MTFGVFFRLQGLVNLGVVIDYVIWHSIHVACYFFYDLPI